jgi:xylulokinase
MGERVPLWDPKARGAFIGINMATRRENFYRAVLEGIAFSLKKIWNSCQNLSIKFNNVSLSGGGAKNDLWKRIIVDILGIKCYDLMYPEDAGTIGVSSYINVALGMDRNILDYLDRTSRIKNVIIPDKKKSKIYEKYYKIYCKCYPALAEIMHLLVDLQEEKLLKS